MLSRQFTSTLIIFMVLLIDKGYSDYYSDIDDDDYQDGKMCYYCGMNNNSTTDSCEEFLRSSSWTRFSRKCHIDALCAKTVFDTGRVARSCISNKNKDGQLFENKCVTSKGVTTCFCQEDYCNLSIKLIPNIILVLIPLLLIK